MKSDRDSALMLLRIAREDERAFLVLVEQAELLRQAFFHAQQAIEKALKAVLAIYGVPVRKTHDLEELYGSLESGGAICPIGLDDLVQLTPYAGLFRYDDADIPKLDSIVARSVVMRTLEWAASQIEGSPQS